MHSSLKLVAALFALVHVVSGVPVADSTLDTEAKALTFDYIVIGSGAGGGVLASRLARANNSVLLIESGNDQGNNVNYTVPAYAANVVEDPKLSWKFFVNHYQDQTRAQRDPNYVWDIGGGQQHVGPNPPSGAKPLGIL
jgi:choline dehydrogenase